MRKTHSTFQAPSLGEVGWGRAADCRFKNDEVVRDLPMVLGRIRDLIQ